jgi:hypothetical protein
VYRDPNPGQNYNMIIGKGGRRVQYLETALTNQNSTQEEIKSRLNSRKCFLSFGAESLVFQFATHKYKDLEETNFPCCFVWV